MRSIAEDVIPAAARNNADWCDLFARLHGCRGVFAPDAWTSPRRTPDGYPDAVTLGRSVDAASLISRIDLSPGASVKDSYANLDLTPWGFERLFEASWIHLVTSAGAGRRPAASWRHVRSDAQLAAWETAWGRPPAEPRLFPSGLLGRDDVAVLASCVGDIVEAGAILSVGGGAVGVSNLFVAPPATADRSGIAAAFAAAAFLAGERFPGLPIVGYQRGRNLEAAMDAGFEPIRPLTVWLRP